MAEKIFTEPIVAFTGHDRVGTYRTAEDVPENSIAFSSWQEMALVLSVEAMDAARSGILGLSSPASLDNEDAAAKLWNLIVAKVPFGLPPPPKPRPKNLRRKKKERLFDNLGNRRMLTKKAHELLHFVYRPGESEARDSAYNKQPKQCKKMSDIVLEDGRKVWTIVQLNLLMELNRDRIGSSQTDLSYLLMWYMKKELYPRRVFRRLTYSEFAVNPQFAGMKLNLEVDDFIIRETGNGLYKRLRKK